MSSPSSNPNVLFQVLLDTALEEYHEKTGKDIAADPLTARLLGCNSSGAVLDILEEQAHAFDQFREGKLMVQLMRRLKPTVHILFGLSTSGVFGEGIGLKFPPAKAVFAGVGLLLAAAEGVSASYEALIELFECFEHYLGRLEVLTKISPAQGVIVVKIMVELLKTLALAMQQIKQGRFKKFAKKLIGEKDIEAVLQRLDRLTVEESRMTTTQTMEVVNGLFENMNVVMDYGKTSIDKIQVTLVTMQKILDDLNKIKCDQLREKIQKWLDPPNPSINHNVVCEAHHVGTATWFLKGPIYDEWKATGSLLWTHGHPGSGKSVLCSSIIKDIEPILATGLASVAYYYFDYKDTRKQDRRGLLSSFLVQLFTRSHRAYDILSKLYETHENGLREPSEVALIQCLKNVLKLPRHGKVYIIVDAVDESPNRPGIPSPREKVLWLMNELLNPRHPDIRVCITSRPEVDIQTVLKPLASHAVSLHDEGGQRGDIIKYVKSVVESDTNMRKWRPEYKQLVIDSLPQKANGMFRLAFLQLDTLRRCFPESIQRTLDELPTTLDETYKRILLEIDREKREHAIRLFKCLAFSRRLLHVKELAEVLAIQFGTAIPSLNKSLRPEDADEAVLSACSTLVAIVKPDGFSNSYARVVQFSHYSVKEFLTSERLAESDDRDLSQYYISPESSHTVLTQTCISTLLQLDTHIGDTTESFPLSQYAAQNWFHHAQYGVASQMQDGMERLFDPDRKHFAVWVSMHNIDHVPSRSRLSGSPNPPGPSPLYYAALCDFGSLVRYLIITHRQDPNKSHGGWGTPLHAAAVLGHTAIARFLLEQSADVNARDKYHSTPLHEASGSGNLDIIQLLLGSYADINVFDYRGDSPLHKAFQYQKFDAMKLLVEGGADVNARSMSNSTLLYEALERGYCDVMELLLRPGADVNALDHQGNSLLHKAFQYQKFDAMNLLVNRGVDVNVRNKSDSTLLHEASGIGDLNVIQFLLSRGAAVNVLDHRGDSPLHKAFRYHGAVMLLINGGADVNARNKSNSTPLHEASGMGNLAVMQLLLSRGAIVNVLDHRKDSPLHKALRYDDAVKLLVNGGADVNVRNKFNSTPLHEASGSGNFDVIQLLLSSGADVNVFDHRGDPPLHKAFQHQNFDAVELLVNGGADVNARNKLNSTSLHEASGSENLDIIQLLLYHGADANALDHWGDSPLHKAFRYDDAVKHLVLGGADVNVRNKFNSTPLHEASGSGSLDVMQLLLSCGADVNVLDHRGDSPLHKALRHHDAVKVLVLGGADVNARNKLNSTPLHEASGSGNLDIIQLLLFYGADANALDHRGDSPLHKAFRNHNAVKLLVNGGADVNVRNKLNSTLLHDASGSGNLDVIQFLLSCGADVNAFGHQGVAPLHEASRYQQLDAMKLLVEGGADVNVRDKFNSTPLHEASGSGNLEVMHLLLSLSADVNAPDHRGVTPLHKASQFQKLDAMKLLVEGGADANVRDKSNSAPIHEASGSGNLDIMQLLLSRGADVNVLDHWGDSPLRKAFQYQKIDAMELLVNAGANVNVRNKSNSTLLHEASGSGNLDVARFLLCHGADVNALDHWGDSPLYKSFRSHTLDVVEPPSKGHVKVTHNTYDWTLIRKASSSGNVDLVPPLSKKCTGDMNASDKGQTMPLQDVPQRGKYAMAQLLLAYGADVNARGWRHKPLLDLASLAGPLKVSRLSTDCEENADAQNDED